MVVLGHWLLTGITYQGGHLSRLDAPDYVSRGRPPKYGPHARAVVAGRRYRNLQHAHSHGAGPIRARAWLCRELKLAPEALPFAGELIAVRPDEAEWEGAAERLLHSFALSILVPDGHYAVVSDWINSHHLNGRIVYYRVPGTARAGRRRRQHSARTPWPPS